jgi:hypothetical protein
VRAFDESNIGNQRDYYAAVWWIDDNLREIRKYLAMKSRPHCILVTGGSRFAASSPQDCGLGTWASSFVPPVDRNTVLIYLSDNGWFLPNSKHHFSENGYRTRLVVFDPRATEEPPPWQASATVPRPPNERLELAHSTDLLPTILGMALGTSGTQQCPASSRDGTPCDGRDLRPYLQGATAAQPPPPLRRALCGHHTQRGTSPSRQRYLLTRPGAVGRCVDMQLPACTTATDCAPGDVCLAGRCTAAAEAPCDATTPCPAGSRCITGRCRVGPPCVDDASCAGMFGSSTVRCVEPGAKWCRNAPHQTCTVAADCPACPGGPLDACGRVCEAQQLKLYVGIAGTEVEMVDLFRDPDERGRVFDADPSNALVAMSSLSGPHATDLRRLACCIDGWWPEAAAAGSVCRTEDTCPADFSCVD